MEKSETLEILVQRLPREFADLIRNDYNKKIGSIISRGNYSNGKENNKWILDNIEVIKKILVLSIYYRRVIASFDGAVNFYSRVTSNGDAEIIQIGGFAFDIEEKNKIISIVIGFNRLLSKYGLNPQSIDSTDDYKFIVNIRRLFLDDMERNRN